MLGIVGLLETLWLWFRVKNNYEGWKKSPLFWDVAKFGARNPERAWKIYIIVLIAAMDIAALVIILMFVLGRYSFY